MMGIRSIYNLLCEKSDVFYAFFGPSIFIEDLALNKRLNEGLENILEQFKDLPIPEPENKEVQDE